MFLQNLVVQFHCYQCNRAVCAECRVHAHRNHRCDDMNPAVITQYHQELHLTNTLIRQHIEKTEAAINQGNCYIGEGEKRKGTKEKHLSRDDAEINYYIVSQFILYHILS